MKKLFFATIAFISAINVRIHASEACRDASEFKCARQYLEENHARLEALEREGRSFLAYLNNYLPIKELSLNENLRLARALFTEPCYTPNAYLHARNRCYWVLASLYTWPGVLEAEAGREYGDQKPYTLIELNARGLLVNIYQKGGFGIGQDKHLANIFLRHPDKMPSPAELIAAIETKKAP